MASGQLGAAIRQVGRLFGTGSVSGYTEAQLLARFVQTKDEAAFEAIVHRFGPMVMGVCRQSLSDSHSVDDAFQSTFLVLVRRAHTIRDTALLGNWLYGVAVKVAKRARADSRKRREREKWGIAAMTDPGGDVHEKVDADLGPLLHEELSRLPQKYRQPMVLCFLNGHTHEQAAELLGWPVGTVKGRVARAKDLLRQRLSRRGVTASAAVLSATLAEAASASVSPLLLDQTLKAAMGIAAGGAVAAGLSSAGAYALSEGVVTTMAMTKWKVLLCGVTAVCLAATGASVYAQKGGEAEPAKGQPAKNPLVADESTKPSAGPILSDELAKSPIDAIMKALPPLGDLPPAEDLARKRLEAAKVRLDATMAYYENGTITVDRYLDAARQYIQAVADVAELPADRLKAAEDSVRLQRAMLEREQAKYNVGVGALPNLAEVASSLADAEMALSRLRQGRSTPAKAVSSVVIDEDEADRAQNEKIQKALSMSLSFPFANETPLEDVIKYLQNATVSDELPMGIPMYVDPVGLNEAEKTKASPITLGLEGVKIRTGLRLALKQLDLGYFVREGLLTITSVTSEEFRNVTDPGWQEREQNEAERKAKLEAQGIAPKTGGGGFR